VLPRSQVDDATYAAAIGEAVATRQRWRREYEAAKERAGPQFGNPATETAREVA
jgi:hypothetical protein